MKFQTELERRLAVAAAVCDALAAYVERRTGDPAEDWRLRAHLYRAAAEQLERSRLAIVEMIQTHAWSERHALARDALGYDPYPAGRP